MHHLWSSLTIVKIFLLYRPKTFLARKFFIGLVRVFNFVIYRLEKFRKFSLFGSLSVIKCNLQMWHSRHYPNHLTNNLRTLLRWGCLIRKVVCTLRVLFMQIKHQQLKKDRKIIVRCFVHANCILFLSLPLKWPIYYSIICWDNQC